MYTCARICIEVDFEKGISKAIELFLDGWTHVQWRDYEQLPFKWKYFYEYGHFSWNYPKRSQGNSVANEEQEEEWKQVREKNNYGINSRKNTIY